MSSWPEFSGKVYIVTGGSQGLGRGIVTALAGAGARLAIVGRNEAAAREAARTLDVETLVIAADVAVPAECARVVEEASARFGALDGLVNNAAHFAVKPLSELTPEAATQTFGTNTFGPLFLAQAFAAHVFARGGEASVVNISSIAGARPSPGLSLYCASKAALDMLTKVMAQEWSPRGVRVNAVAPGHIETPGVTEDFATGRLDRAAMTASIPARRIALPEDVAQLVLFLLSPRARHVTGAVMTVDGGEGM